MPLFPGDKLGPYQIDALIGHGGMGEVYKARDTRLDRVVAIKVSQAKFSERFEGEAKAVAALNHPNICQLYDVGPNYLVMEFVDGAPLAAPDTPRKLLDFAVQIAEGMAAAHAAPLVHRDLKPDNILVTGAQSAHPGRVKILDFGLAKTATEASAEEQARGVSNLTAQSDQFSFGLVLYELAARQTRVRAREPGGDHDRHHPRGCRASARERANVAALGDRAAAGQRARRPLRFHARSLPRVEADPRAVFRSYHGTADGDRCFHKSAGSRIHSGGCSKPAAPVVAFHRSGDTGCVRRGSSLAVLADAGRGPMDRFDRRRPHQFNNPTALT
ncbi:MAG TPA: serine/threonine-protein kinase [Bryobacteraceae bacterium]|nr:serine/threonine-protein kinase [Bryobacteraceae bacterium]